MIMKVVVVCNFTFIVKSLEQQLENLLNFYLNFVLLLSHHCNFDFITMDDAIRLCISTLEWNASWEKEHVSIGCLIKKWNELTGCLFPNQDKGFEEVKSYLDEIEGVEVYENFYVRLMCPSYGRGIIYPEGTVKP
ncbi:uncharacterized protein LOC128397617 [Panonychus citri]|uniref:uncharacterized protein LOC128397617 n=1 Tax=Panonychus citri TaxID=50023 RepID=UPI0023080FC9|nr:uncharacterized protein LOC128397617 [Panonychus citri]